MRYAWLFMGMALMFSAGMLVITFHVVARHQGYMADCHAAGHQEWECAAMLRGR